MLQSLTIMQQVTCHLPQALTSVWKDLHFTYIAQNNKSRRDYFVKYVLVIEFRHER